MLDVSAHLSWFSHRGAVYLYHDLWGYIMQMSPDLQEFLLWFRGGREEMAAKQRYGDAFGVEQVETFIAIFRDHGCLVRPGTDEIAALSHAIPVRARWTLSYVKDDGSVVVVAGRSPEATPRLVTLDPWESQLWLRIDGEQSCEQLASAMAGPLQDEMMLDDGEGVAAWEEAMARVVRCVATWTQSELQWTRLSKQPMSFFGGASPRPPYLDSTMPYERLDGAVAPDPFEKDGLFDLRDYHSKQIEDAAAQFDEVETTLSHLFRVPHPALGGQTYAQRMTAALVQMGLLGPQTSAVAEVGGGTGFFARGLLETLSAEHPEVMAGLSYRVVDISPALQASQRTQLAAFEPHVELVTDDGERLGSLADGSLDLLISNEVIADLRTATVRRCDLTGEAPSEEAGEDPTPAEALETLRRHQVPVDDAPDRFCVNLGAMHMLESIARVLRPGGAAVLTEFGDKYRYPVESTHLDHPEYSIHFGHLEHVATRLGLQAEVLELMVLLKMDPDVMTLSSTRTWYRNLCWLAAGYGVQLPKIAWTPELLHEALGGQLDLRRLHLLSWHPVGERVMGLVPREFKALVVRKPG